MGWTTGEIHARGPGMCSLPSWEHPRAQNTHLQAIRPCSIPPGARYFTVAHVDWEPHGMSPSSASSPPSALKPDAPGTMPRVRPPAGGHPCTPRGVRSSSETRRRAAAASRVHSAQHRWVTAYYVAAVTAGDLSGRSDSAASGVFSTNKCSMGFNLKQS